MIKGLSKFVRRSFATQSTGLTTINFNLKTQEGKEVILESKDGDLLIKDPVRATVACLASCELHTMNYHARRRGIKIDDVQISDVSTVIDLEGFRGVEGHTADIKEVNMKVDIKTPGDASVVEQLHKDVAKHCFIYNLFASAGVKMNIEFRKA